MKKLIVIMLILITSSAGLNAQTEDQQLKKKRKFSFQHDIKGGMTFSSFRDAQTAYLPGFIFMWYGDLSCNDYSIGIESGYAEHGGMLKNLTAHSYNPLVGTEPYTCDLRIIVGYIETSILLKHKKHINDQFSMNFYFGGSFSIAPFKGLDRTKMINKKVIVVKDESQYDINYLGEKQTINSIKGICFGINFEYKKYNIDLRYYKANSFMRSADSYVYVDYKFQSFIVMFSFL